MRGGLGPLHQLAALHHAVEAGAEADVAGAAGVSTQYLSESERGRKEPSSEVLSAVAGALGLRLVDLTARVTRQLAARPTGPVCLAA